MTLLLEDLHGQISDLDSHEQTPNARYGEVFGEQAQRFAEAIQTMLNNRLPIMSRDPGSDVVEITPQSVWETKGTAAPSASDLDRRPAVLDMMGIQRALIFPTIGGLTLLHAHAPRSAGELEAALGAMEDHNEWAAHYSRKYPDRMRMVGLLASGVDGVTPQSLVKETERLIDMGLPALQPSAGRPPAGLSPADVALDPWYAAMAEANVPLVFHTGGSAGFRRTEVWEEVPQLGLEERPEWDERDQLPGGAPTSINRWIAEQGFITVMVMGGVFERHPKLRVGAIELGASWIAPLAERMDIWTDKDRHHDWYPGRLPLRPSEYLARQVRVTPYVFEPVEKYVERYPAIRDVYCFSSDYPHIEGNRWSNKLFYDRLAPLGDDFLRRFFVTNGQLLLP